MDRDLGFDALTLPADHDWYSLPDGFDFEACARRDIDAIIQSDAIYLLNGWEASKGARAEKAIAEWLGKEIIYQTEPTSV